VVFAARCLAIIWGAFVNLRWSERNGVKTLQFWNTPDGYAPHWKDVPTVKVDPVKCEDCGGAGGLWDARCSSCNGKGYFDRPEQ
jgi:hypothetical protein